MHRVSHREELGVSVAPKRFGFPVAALSPTMSWRALGLICLFLAATLLAPASALGAEEITGTINPTEAGAEQPISFTSPTQAASFSVPVTAGESVSMESSEAALDAAYRLDWLNPEGEYIRTWYPWGESDRFFESVRFAESGNATLLVTPEEGGTGPITFTLFNASDMTGTIAPSEEGTSKTVSIGVPGQRNLISFEGTKGELVSIAPTEASFDGEFHVNAPEGEWLESSGGNLYNNHGSLVLPETGTYTIVLTGTEAQTGSVKLTAYEVVDVSGAITPLATLEGATQHVEISVPGQVARYSVVMSAGERVSVKMTNSLFSGFYRLRWLGPNDEVLYSENWYGYVSGYVPARSFAEAGTYTLEVDPEATGSLDLALWEDPDLVGQTLSASAEGDSITSTIEVPGQRELVTFEGIAGHYAELGGSESTIESGQWFLLTPGGEQISSGSLTGPSGGVLLPTTGIYTVAVEGNQGSVGGVTLTLHDFAPEEFTGTITPTEAGAEQPISFTSPAQVARFSVPVTAGESISMESSEASLSAGYRVDWLNPEGEYIRTWYPWGESDRFFEAVRFSESGNATLLITPEEGGAGPITFTLFDASDKTNSIAPSESGAAETFSIGAPGQRNLISFEGNKGERVGIAPTESNFEGEFHVVSPEGEWLEGSGGGLGSYHGPVTLPEAGTYTIVLTGSEAQTGSVKLTAYEVVEITGTISPTEAGAEQPISFTSPTQVARFSVPVTAGESISMESSESALSADYRLDWLNPEGEVIRTWYPSGGSDRFFEAVRFAESGNATLLVTPEEGGTGSITFTLFDASDKTNSITPSESGTAETYLIGAPGQRNLISFEGSKGERVGIAPSEPDFEGEFHVDTPEGKWLEGSGGNLSAAHGPLTLSEAGNYTIVLTALEAQIGSVKLTAYHPDITGTITPTEAGTNRSTTFVVAGEVARYSVPVSAGESISMESSESALSAGYRLDWLNPEGEYLHSWWPGGETDRFFEPVSFSEAGNATLVINPEGSATGSITLTLFDASDRKSSITLRPRGSSKAIPVLAPGQRDLISFKAKEGDALSFEPTEADFEGEFHVNTPEGEWLEGSGGDLKTAHGPLTLPEAGVYTIILTGSEAQTGSVNLCARLETGGTSPAACALVVAYALDEGEGRVAHDSGGSNDGTLEGPSWVAGKYEKALKFEAEEEDSLFIPPAPGLELTSFTLEAWVFPEQDLGPGPVLSQPGDKGGNIALYADAGPEGTPEGAVTEGSSTLITDAPEALPIDTWSHLAMTCDGEDLTLYVNGEAVDSSKASCAEATLEPITVGADLAPTEESFFSGRIDEIRIYNQALSAEDIADDSRTPLLASEVPKAPEPAAAYSFEEGSGSLASDLMGGKDATLSGPTWIEGEDNGGALLFSAPDHDLMDIPAVGPLGLDNSFTVEAMVQPRFPEGPSPIFTNYSAGGDGFSLDVIPRSELGTGVWSLQGSLTDGAEEAEMTGSGAFSSYQWKQVALTYDGEYLRLYVNGELETAEAAPGLPPSEGDLLVGGDPEASAYFNGGVDDVRVYRQALTSAELLENLEIPLENPRILVNGPLWERGPEQLVSPAGELYMAVSDLKGKVERVSFFVDGKETRSTSREEFIESGGEEHCIGNWCDLTFDAGGLFPASTTSGEHTLEIVALDSHGVERRRSHLVDLDTHAPTLTVSGPLIEAEGGPLPEEAAALEISASDLGAEAESGLEEIEVEVDGTTIESVPFSAEDAGKLEYVYKESEWGTGPRRVTVVARDSAGNQSVKEVRVNSRAASVAPACSGREPEVVESGTTVSASEAEKSIEAAVPDALMANQTEGTTLSPKIGEEEIGAFLEEAFKVAGSVTGGRILASPAGGATIGQAACVLPSEVSESASAPVPVPAASAVLFPNAGPEMDTLVRATALGSDILDSLRGPAAPNTLSWSIATKEGQTLVPLESGGVAVSAQEVQPVVTSDEREPLAGGGDPGLINQVKHQGSASVVDINAANAELGEVADAVIPAATAISETGASTNLELSVNAASSTISVAVPAGTAAVLLRLESAPDPVAICAQAFEREPRLYEAGCGNKVQEETPTLVSRVDWAPSGKLYLDARVRGPREALPGGGITEEIIEPSVLRSESDGSQLEEVIGPAFVQALSSDVSPSGKLMAFEACEVSPGGSCGIFMKNLTTAEVNLIAPLADPELSVSPTFGPSGSRLYFYRNEARPLESEGFEREVWSMNLDGSDKKRLTAIDDEEPCSEGDFCNHGISDNHLSVGGSPENVIFVNGGDIWEVNASAENATPSAMTALTEGGGVVQAEFSPSGNKIAYSRQGAGGSKAGLYQMKPNGTDQTFLTPTANTSDYLPVYFSYAPNENELAFVSDGAVYKVGTGGNQYASFVSQGEDNTPFAQLVSELTPEQASEEYAIEDEIQRLRLELPIIPGEVNGALNPGERAFCFGTFPINVPTEIVHAEECNAFFNDKAYADKQEYYLFHYEGSDDNTIANAFVHSYWTALMIRDTQAEENGKPDGLEFARLHEGDPPYDKESEMDFINDRVGTNYWLLDRFNHTEAGKDKIEVCAGLLIKAKHAIYLPPKQFPRPGVWARTHTYRFRRLVYYLLRSMGRKGDIVVAPTGMSCSEADAEPDL